MAKRDDPVQVKTEQELSMPVELAPSTHQAIAEQLRSGLRRLGKAVVVITCWHDDRRWAMTATAVSELSLDPPSLLVCVNKSASMYAPLTQGANFCVNILHADQVDVSNAGSGATKGEDRFAVGSWGASPCQTPFLEGAQASFLCQHERYIEHGTHAIVIGRVIQVEAHGEVDPLIYVDGGYARATPYGRV
jgi:flavin reductase (DIM6/NTAB) family NADH-FMN oxidoreductase RutF